MKRNTSEGNVLVVALILIMVVSGFILLAVNVTNGAARLTDRSRDFIAAQSAAEGAVEYAFGIWRKKISLNNGAITTSQANEASTFTPPSFPGFVYGTVAEDGPLRISALDQYGSSVNDDGSIRETSVPVFIDLASYPGWRGRSFTYVARAKMKMADGTYKFAAGVKRLFQYSEVPLFQAMFFFEDNLEFYKPAQMNITGLVHTNSFAYLSNQEGVPVTFNDEVSYVTGYTHEDDPPYADQWSGWSANATRSPVYTDGIENQLHQVPRFEPLGTEPASTLNTTDTNTNNDSMRELIETPNTAFPDPPEIAQRRLFNKAGVVININGAAITVTGKNGLTLTSAKETEIRNTITARGTIYDQREGKNVDVATLDVSKLNTALSTGVPGFNNTIYVHDTTPLTAGNLEPKAVRLKNGGVLPTNGLTLASENAVYIQGDYNTGTTTNPSLVPANSGGNANNTDEPTVPGYTRRPAAVIADAVMFLSNNWNDSNSNKTLSSRVASNTTYNTAIVSGFMPSGYQPPSGSQYGYSGGANNFPRFLEDWTGDYCTYFGSMVELYKSKTFTGEWDTGVIFRPPVRCWNFDPQFRNTPPPGSVDAVSWSRGPWMKY